MNKILIAMLALIILPAHGFQKEDLDCATAIAVWDMNVEMGKLIPNVEIVALKYNEKRTAELAEKAREICKKTQSYKELTKSP